MARTTNRITFDEARDLVTGAARACVGFVRDGTPHVEPVTAWHEDGRFTVLARPGFDIEGIDEIVLVADDGYFFFDLRAVYVRGRPVDPAAESLLGGVRFDIEPDLITCWDYGTLRVDHAAA